MYQLNRFIILHIPIGCQAWEQHTGVNFEVCDVNWPEVSFVTTEREHSYNLTVETANHILVYKLRE